MPLLFVGRANLLWLIFSPLDAGEADHPDRCPLLVLRLFVHSKD